MSAGPVDQFAGIAAIGKDFLKVWHPTKQPDQYSASANTILNTG
jgi:hypothetical protein